MAKPKIFVLGLDGATLDVVEPLVGQGRLPNFRTLMAQGAYGRLRSTVPPHTAPGWVSAVTGVGPGSHGIYQFWDTQAPQYVGDFMASHDCRVPKLWDILNGHGLTTGIINVPMTHPPREIDGYIIAWPLTQTLRYSYPRSLIGELASAGCHCLPDLFTMFRGNLDYIDEAVQITAKRQKTVQYLLRKHPVDFLMVVFSEIDRISHYYWHYYDRHSKYYDDHVAEKYRNALADIYERTDTALGSILCDLPEDCLLVVVSDHGFGRGQVNFHLQDFLIDNGFARVKSAAPEAQERAPGNWFVFGQDGASYELDWDRTRCFMACPGSYGININLRDRQRRGVVGPDELEALTRDLQSALRSVRSPETGEPLFESVLPRQAVYHGPTVERAPDMVVQPRSYGTMLHHRIVRGNWFSEPEHKGMHRLWGIVMVAGPGIQPGRLRDAALEDIAPTLLSWLSLPVPGHMEGQCLPVLGATGGHRSPTPGDQRQDAGGGAAGAAPNTYSPEEKKEIAARLSALGYL